MQINGPKKLVKRAVCCARALGVSDFTLNLVWSDEYTECTVDEAGVFTISVRKDTAPFMLIYSVAHEMVHLKQYKRDELTGDCEPVGYWKGEAYFAGEYMSDEYFLAPWEMEARALEEWLAHKWRNRKRELH